MIISDEKSVQTLKKVYYTKMFNNDGDITEIIKKKGFPQELRVSRRDLAL